MQMLNLALNYEDILHIDTSAEVAPAHFEKTAVSFETTFITTKLSKLLTTNYKENNISRGIFSHF